MFNKTQKEFLLKTAREAITAHLESRRQTHADKIDPVLLEKKGVFVTLTIDESLRGCIGSILPESSLYEGVIDNAINAAFRDPRFYPLQKDELRKIKIEISVLTPPKEVKYSDPADLLERLKPGKDGVILSKGRYGRATYLPQVWEDLPDKELFLSSLCGKAGLPADEWKKGTLKVETYAAEKFEEE